MKMKLCLYKYILFAMGVMLGYSLFYLVMQMSSDSFPIDFELISTTLVFAIILIGISIIVYFVEYYLIIIYRGIIKPKIIKKGRK